MSGAQRSTIVRHRYIRSNAKLSGKLWDALYYLQHRPLGEDEHPQDRTLFTAHTAGLFRQEGRALLLEHAGARVAYHRLILSPGVPVRDLQAWTRRVMADLGRHQGMDLHWVAVAHRNTAHHHVHVLLASTGERAESGRTDQVRLYRDDYSVLRESGDRHGRALSEADRGVAEAIRSELGLAVADFAGALIHEFTDDGVQTHKHLAEDGTRSGAPGRDATHSR